MSKGRLVVIDGIDGSGKSTQIELLASQGVPLQVISFPRYEDNIYGKLIKRYLEGEFGSINEVSPYFMACVFAGDRILAKPQIEKWLSEGKLVLSNRYISSNKAHMGAKLPAEKREEFFCWLDELEYETNKLPKEDLTILLSVDPEIAQNNVANTDTDIHEESLKHLEEANDIYLSLAEKEPNWYVVDCMKDGCMRTKEDIGEDIMRILQNEKI